MTTTYFRVTGGKVHKSVDGMTHEADNIDQARSRVPVGSLAEVDLGDLCERCWPPSEAEAVLEATQAQDGTDPHELVTEDDEIVVHRGPADTEHTVQG